MKYYVYASKTKLVNIDTSMFKGTPFQCNTGMSYYNDFLNEDGLKYKQEAKNRTGEIRMMSPEDYYDYCSMFGFNHYVSVSKLKQGRRANDKTIKKYEDMMRNGTKFHLCVLNKVDHTQEGLHRMMAAGNVFGWNKKFPVLVITAYDQELENQYLLYREAVDYRDYKFKDYCKWASTTIRNYRSPVPDNFIELYRDAITEKVKEWGRFDGKDDIDFDIKVVDNSLVEVYLTRYKTYMFENPSNPFTIFLEDMYDTEGHYQDIPPIDLHDVDDSDLFI